MIDILLVAYLVSSVVLAEDDRAGVTIQGIAGVLGQELGHIGLGRRVVIEVVILARVAADFLVVGHGEADGVVGVFELIPSVARVLVEGKACLGFYGCGNFIGHHDVVYLVSGCGGRLLVAHVVVGHVDGLSCIVIQGHDTGRGHRTISAGGFLRDVELCGYICPCGCIHIAGKVSGDEHAEAVGIPVAYAYVPAQVQAGFVDGNAWCHEPGFGFCFGIVGSELQVLIVAVFFHLPGIAAGTQGPSAVHRFDVAFFQIFKVPAGNGFATGGNAILAVFVFYHHQVVCLRLGILGVEDAVHTSYIARIEEGGIVVAFAVDDGIIILRQNFVGDVLVVRIDGLETISEVGR